MPLKDPITSLKGVGPRMAERLRKLRLHSVEDLLYHVPIRYEDRTRITPIGDLQPGSNALIQGTIRSCEVRMGRRRSLLCQLSDSSGVIALRFFHFSAAQQAQLVSGTSVRCFGEPRQVANRMEMAHPEYQHVDLHTEDPPHTPVAAVDEQLTPIYRSTAGLQQRSLRLLCQQALSVLDISPTDPALHEWLPNEILQEQAFPTLLEALAYLHGPPPDAPLALMEDGRHPAQRRLAFEELLARVLSMARLRKQLRSQHAPPLNAEPTLRDDFLARLPFQLTGAQQRVIDEIAADLKQDTPMLRLVQGDVGSGKTVVAAAAALQCVAAGHQVTLMAPTELLAEQHLKTLGHWLAPLEISVASLLGKQTKSERKPVLQQLANGDVQICIGTHALFQREVRFASLGLCIIDEQHRFGVQQRLALKDKGVRDKETVEDLYPHQLIMTATPIPRTLAMLNYADLDISVIDEAPPHRQPVVTAVVPDSRRDEVIQRIAHACQQARQVYWVCTLIDESETLQCQAANDTVATLSEQLPGVKVGLVHGRLKAEEKDQVMAAFAAGQLDLLVATTVIEVGVDVPNATLIIIENAERLGLAQLHQLRGRIGRGHQQSHCVLMYHPPLTDYSRERLATLRKTSDGFEIARQDLKLRGPGEVLGTKQAGLPQLRFADLSRDQDLMPKVTHTAKQMMSSHVEVIDPLIERWLGSALKYGKV